MKRASAGGKTMRRGRKSWPASADVLRATRVAAGKSVFLFASSARFDFKWCLRQRPAPGSEAMPIFEYVCRAATISLKLGIRRPESRVPQVPRPQTGAAALSFCRELQGRLTAAPLTGGCGTCGDPRGPGSCCFPTETEFSEADPSTFARRARFGRDDNVYIHNNRPARRATV